MMQGLMAMQSLDGLQLTSDDLSVADTGIAVSLTDDQAGPASGLEAALLQR